MATPRGYWTHVFNQARLLLDLRPELTGDQAYWLARRQVDNLLAEQKMQLELTPLQPPATLTLEPPK